MVNAHNKMSKGVLLYLLITLLIGVHLADNLPQFWLHGIKKSTKMVRKLKSFSVVQTMMRNSLKNILVLNHGVLFHGLMTEKLLLLKLVFKESLLSTCQVKMVLQKMPMVEVQLVLALQLIHMLRCLLQFDEDETCMNCKYILISCFFRKLY